MTLEFIGYIPTVTEFDQTLKLPRYGISILSLGGHYWAHSSEETISPDGNVVTNSFEDFYGKGAGVIVFNVAKKLVFAQVVNADGVVVYSTNDYVPFVGQLKMIPDPATVATPVAAAA